MLNDDTMHLSLLGRLVRRRWALLAVYAIVGGLIGAGASLLFSPGYQSRSSVLLQGPLAEDELRTQALIATSSVVLERTAEALGNGVGVEELRGSVGAEVLDGNVIEIQASARTSGEAQRLAQRVTREYVAYSEELATRARGGMRQLLESLRQQVTDISTRIDTIRGGAAAAVQPETELARLRTTLAETLTAVEEVSGNGGETAFGKASVIVLEPADLPQGPSAPTQLHLTAGGALLVLLLAVFAHLVSERANREPRTEAEIAAALGSPILGSVDVVTGAGSPGDGTKDARDREVRYQRVLARLRDGRSGNLRILVVVDDDDTTAHHAVAALAVVAGSGRIPALVVTDDPGFAQLVRAASEATQADNVRLTIAPSTDPEPAGRRTVLQVVHVSTARATVPENSRAHGVLLVLSSGTQTGWELVRIAEACSDAGHEVMGALVTYRTTRNGARRGTATDNQSLAVSANGKAKAATS